MSNMVQFDAMQQEQAYKSGYQKGREGKGNKPYSCIAGYAEGTIADAILCLQNDNIESALATLKRAERFIAGCNDGADAAYRKYLNA